MASDIGTSIVRTVASKMVGAGLGVALALGVAVPAHLSEQMTVALTGALALGVQLVYYVVARWLEQRVPGIGKMMLWSGRVPQYGADLPVNVRVVVDQESVGQQIEVVRRELENARQRHGGARPGRM